MAKIKFKDTYDLINYLCRNDVLGQLVISYSQNAPFSLYNFDYSDLEKHLDSILFDLTEGIRGVRAYKITFLDADDWDIEAEDNDEYSGINLSREITESLENIIRKELQLEAYVLMEIEGNDFWADSFKINKFEVYDWKDQKDPLKLNPNLKRKLFEEIASILQRMKLELETISHFCLETPAGSDYISFSATGSPYLSGYFDFDDEEEFTLDTEKLKPRI